MAHKVDKSKPARYASADKSLIDLHVHVPGHGSVPMTIGRGEELFNEATAGLYGPVQPYEAPVMVPTARPLAILSEFDRRIEVVIKGRSSSMLREAMYIQNLIMSGTELTDEQKYMVQVFKDLNDWETAMVERREELIARGDVETALLDVSWPAPPASLTDSFLRGF